ncbi:MAG TPA: M14 family zinc carboxypeptidase [Ignavibacteriaceae bacterium]
MKIYLCLLLLFVAINNFSQELLTPLQKSNYEKLTTHSELSQFIKEFDESSKLITSEILTKSVEGRELFAVYFSNSEFGKDESKIKVLIFAQQHGNEQSGKEGALLLVSELLKPENQYLFDKIDLVLIPQMNPDGSEKNQRRNGNSMDLNRNHLILTEPETIALHNLFDKYLFEVTMDVHEYWPFGEESKKYGYVRKFDETIGAMTNINISEKLRELSYQEYLPFIFKYISGKGFSVFHYVPGGPPDIDYIRYSTFDINDGRQSFGIQNSFSFIQEGLNGQNYSTDNIEHRAKGQMVGMRGLLEFAYNHNDEIKSLVKTEREKLVSNNVSDKVAIQLDHFADGSKLEIPMFSYYSNRDTVITVNDFRPVVKSIFDVERPKGYLIPKNLKEVVEWADKHKLIYNDYKKTNDDRIEQYYISGIDSMDFERDIIVNPIVELQKMTTDLCESDYIFIPVDQLRNNMIVIALEPKSELGLVTYKQFEHLLKKGEIFPILRLVK